MNKLFLYFLLCTLLVSSCAVKKHLPKDSFLYNGATVKIKNTPDHTTATKSLRKTLKASTFPAKNKMILGYPYKVAWWYLIGEPKKPKGFKNWLRNRLGEPPVFHSMADEKANVENIRAQVENKGHFGSDVSAAFTVKKYKKKNNYQVLLTRPYLIDTVRWALDSSQLSKDILSMKITNAYLKPNDQFDIENIKAETKRTDLVLKREGYYYFSQDYIKTYVDTTGGNHKANLILSIKKDAPLLARTPQRIQNIYIFPNYTLINPPPDTSKRGLIDYKGKWIRDTVKQFKPSALVQSLTYDTGSLYDMSRHNESLNRFINMGAFKFVKSRYQASSDSVNPSLMNVYYYLTPYIKKNITTELAGFTKSNSFTGASANVNWKNRNTFRGAEQLKVKTYGAFEISANDSLRQNNNWRLGTEVSLTVPRNIFPIKLAKNPYFPTFSKISLGYEWMRRQLLFTRKFFRLQGEVTWKKKVNSEHTFAPFSITYNRAGNFSPEYLNTVNQFPVLQFANRPELITGLFYNYLTTSRNPRAKKLIYFNGSIDIAGNIPGAILKPDTAFSKTIAGAYFAQYAKLDADFRYTRRLAKELYLVNRISVGAAIPYGNSAYLPFSKQFIIGGSNSLRGFRPRQLGPGRVLTTAEQQVSYPQIGGDFKLEVQSELRFPIFNQIKGALFAEAGNIWTKTDLLYGPEGKLNSNFMKDIAVDAGAGIRIDIDILILRFDFAIPLRKPWLPLGSEWVTKDSNFGNSSWFKDNLIFNIGIGYPF